MTTDEQFLERCSGALRHVDDTLAFVDSDNPPTLAGDVAVKWIDHPSEHADEPGQFLATQDPEVIMFWAEDRHGKPALLRAADRNDPAQALRFQVTDRIRSEYELISWDEWFALMNAGSLTFIFRERSSEGSISDLFTLVPSSSVKRT